MVSPAKIKWFLSILLAGMVLVLGLSGGNWGKTYAADLQDDPPMIDKIVPSHVIFGRPFVYLGIYGSNFDITKNPRVWLITKGEAFELDPPAAVDPQLIVQLIPGSYLPVPIVYDLKVVQDSSSGTVPTNSVKFYVDYAIFYPFISK